MTLLVSAVLLFVGAVMALKLPRAMDCGAAEDEAAPAAGEAVRLPAQAKGEVRSAAPAPAPAPVEQAG